MFYLVYEELAYTKLNLLLPIEFLPKVTPAVYSPETVPLKAVGAAGNVEDEFTRCLLLRYLLRALGAAYCCFCD